MKTEIIQEQAQFNPDTHNWSKPMLYRSKHGEIVLSSGEYTMNTFSGTVVVKSPESYKEGKYSTNCAKSSFTPITHPITIKFIP